MPGILKQANMQVVNALFREVTHLSGYAKDRSADPSGAGAAGAT